MNVMPNGTVRKPGFENWQRCPSDGTSYRYWVLGADRPAEGGFLIETKPRFRSMGYWLYLPHELSPIPGYGLRFDTLRAAKLCAESSRTELLKLGRRAVRDYVHATIAWSDKSFDDRLKEICELNGVAVEQITMAE